MSYRLTRIRRVLAEPPQEPFTHHVNNAVCAHWKSLFTSPQFMGDKLSDQLRAVFAEQERCCADAEEKHQRFVAAQLDLWEAKRDAFQLEATLGGQPGQPGPLGSADWGMHWILFHWQPPATGGPVWGYRIERSADNRDYYLADMGVEPEITVQHQPQNVKLYYRVVAFNGWGDGPPSPVFGIRLDPELVDEARRDRPPTKGAVPE
jgi:hypothetical protein